LSVVQYADGAGINEGDDEDEGEGEGEREGEGEGEGEGEEEEGEGEGQWNWSVDNGDNGDSGAEEEGPETGGTGGGETKVSDNRKSKPKGHRGRPAGSAGYQKGEEWILVEAVGKHKPRSEPGWHKATKHYNSKVQKERQREWDILKNKWNRVSKLDSFLLPHKY
jgi:X-linked retinitis pigmentosa GTPase regulator